MSWARPAALLLVALALAGCGGAERGGGQATLWVTHDRGETLVLETRVEAGQTLMRALRGVAKVETRYGGRFVQAVNGIEGSVASQRDWFWFVNGYEGDRSAAEYELRPGDIAWLDYRSWRDEDRAPIVVGAFPEPFLHGYDGERRPVAVRYAAPEPRRCSRDGSGPSAPSRSSCSRSACGCRAAGGRRTSSVRSRRASACSSSRPFSGSAVATCSGRGRASRCWARST